MRVEVTYTNAGGTDTAHSTPTGVVDGVAPANVVDPALSGTARDGQTLTLDDGDWSGTPALVPSYQWQRCDASGGNCADIAGETGLTYTLRSADIGDTVRRARHLHERLGPGLGGHDAERGRARRAARRARSTRACSASPPTARPSTPIPACGPARRPIDYTYQWLRCDLDGTNCSDIAGATEDTYTLTSADVGHGVRVEVTGTNAAGSASGTSAVAAVNALAPQNTTLPTVSGSPVDAHTLTADRRHVDRHHAARATTTSGCAATPTARTASPSPARRARPTT